MKIFWKIIFNYISRMGLIIVIVTCTYNIIPYDKYDYLLIIGASMFATGGLVKDILSE